MVGAECLGLADDVYAKGTQGMLHASSSIANRAIVEHHVNAVIVNATAKRAPHEIWRKWSRVGSVNVFHVHIQECTMRFVIAFALVLAACGTPSQPAQQHHAVVGDPCDPNGGVFIVNGTTDTPCPEDDSQQCHMVYPECGDGLVCDATGVCGEPCGNGNTVCDPGQECTAQGDCVPPCLVNGQPWVPPGVTNCTLVGTLEGQDGGCIVPCWWALCSIVGGSCG
jgi:hypothetical protein